MKIYSDICLRTLSVPRSQRSSESVGLISNRFESVVVYLSAKEHGMTNLLEIKPMESKAQ